MRDVNRIDRDRETGREKSFLSDVSVGFNLGEVTALIGPSECGKSTLLKAIYGVEQADRSTCEIYFNGGLSESLKVACEIYQEVGDDRFAETVERLKSIDPEKAGAFM